MVKERLQKHRDREKLLEGLQQELAISADIFSTEADENDEKNYKCEGAVQALLAVLIYLREEKFDRRQVEPLKALLGALADADEGTKNKLTAVRKRSGAPPRQHDRSADLAFASAIVTLLMGSGKGEEDAALQVSRVLYQCGVSVGKSREGSEAVALINWRKKVMAGSQGDVATGIYEANCADQYKDFPANELLNVLRGHLENKVP